MTSPQVTTTRTALEAAVLRFLSQRQQALGLPLAEVSQATVVVDTGLLDSLSLIELVAAVEAATGQAVDMLRFDPSAFDTAGELVDELVAALKN